MANATTFGESSKEPHMTPALFSVSYAGFWGQSCLPLFQFIDKARELGYPAVMLMGKRPHLAPLDYMPEQAAAIKEHLERRRVACPVVGAYTDFACAGAAEVPYLEMQVAYVAALAGLARAVGATIVRVFTGYEAAGLPPATVWSRVVTGLQECCDRAAAEGVTIAIQNHHDLAVHSDALLELLGDVDRPNCKLGFDAWSLWLRGEDLFEAARRMAPYAACTTNADYVRLPRFRYRAELVNYVAEPAMVRAVPFGEGAIDYAAFFAGLREGGFDGPATYEMCSPLRGGGSLANLDRYATRYLAWMKTHAGPAPIAERARE
jgi:sugar phosphate isomerase/epimerase